MSNNRKVGPAMSKEKEIEEIRRTAKAEAEVKSFVVKEILNFNIGTYNIFENLD